MARSRRGGLGQEVRAYGRSLRRRRFHQAGWCSASARSRPNSHRCAAAIKGAPAMTTTRPRRRPRPLSPDQSAQGAEPGGVQDQVVRRHQLRSQPLAVGQPGWEPGARPGREMGERRRDAETVHEARRPLAAHPGSTGTPALRWRYVVVGDVERERRSGGPAPGRRPWSENRGQRHTDPCGQFEEDMRRQGDRPEPGQRSAGTTVRHGRGHAGQVPAGRGGQSGDPPGVLVPGPGEPAR
jgi:hypothetical protein